MTAKKAFSLLGRIAELADLGGIPPNFASPKAVFQATVLHDKCASDLDYLEGL